MTANIPEVVESLIATSVADDDACSAPEIHRTALAIWNRFVAEYGSFSDEYSTL